MLSLYSWNVNGIRAAQNKGFLDWLRQTRPDILAIQETKTHPDQLGLELRNPEVYHVTWASAERKGYSDEYFHYTYPAKNIRGERRRSRQSRLTPFAAPPGYAARGRTVG
jgi:exodeoxyribonuclease-3